MRKYFYLSLLLLIAAIQAWACGPTERPNYYMFSAFNREQMGSTFDYRINEYWKNYVGKGFNDWDVSSLSYFDIDNMQNSQNSIVKTALAHNDIETIKYLKHLVTYLRICGNISEDRWDYPSPDDLNQANQNLIFINQDALNYSGKRYKAQYALLVMRTYFLLKKYPEVINYWNSTASKLPESVFKDMMKDFYAGCLLRNGQKKEACRTYAELGDMRSIKWCMRDQRNLAGIKKEYAEDPNSPNLIYLVQDFVNNAQDTNDSEKNQNLVNTNYDNEIKNFIAFAGKVVNNGKTQVPALWQSAMGFLNFMMSEKQLAIRQLEQATGMKGTQRMKDNARACLLLARIDATQQMSNSFSNYLVQEFKWLKNAIQEEEKISPTSGNHYIEVISRLTFDNLIPKFYSWGRPEVGINTAMMATSISDSDFELDGYYDNLSAVEYIKCIEYQKTSPKDPFEKWLMQFANAIMNKDKINDNIGTKYLREGQWAKAIPYLKQVPLSYISNQNISRYMAKRTYHQERWIKRQVVDYENKEAEWMKKYTVSANQKLQFCQDVLNLQGSSDPQDMYKLASMLYQASYKGDCWYLARNRWSPYDSVSYKNEYNFIDQTINLLKQVKATTRDLRLKEKCLYALAFIPQGEGWFSFEYDENYNVRKVLNRTNEQFLALQELSKFVGENMSNVSSFVSRCDVIQDFRLSTMGEQATDKKKTGKSSSRRR